MANNMQPNLSADPAHPNAKPDSMSASANKGVSDIESTNISDFNKLAGISWARSNNYHVFYSANTMLGKLPLPHQVLLRDLNLYIEQIDTPDISYNSMDTTFMGYKRFAQGDQNTLTFSITFRDSDQMQLYLAFLKIQTVQSSWYFEDYCGEMTIFKRPEYDDGKNQKQFQILQFNGVSVDGVSNLSINSSSVASVAQFTVRFKAETVAISSKFPITAKA